MEPNELMHHGIKGQKWHVRRFQNKDGSLTVAGKKRYSTGSDGDAKTKFKDMVDKYKAKRAASKAKKEEARKAAEAAKPKSIGNMDNDELRKTIESLQLKKQAYQLQKDVSSFEPKKVSKGKQFISEMTKDAVVPALKDATKEVGAKWLKKTLSKKLGLDEVDELSGLKKEAEKLKLKKEIDDLKNPKESVKDKLQRLRDEKELKDLEDSDAQQAKRDTNYWRDKNNADKWKKEYEARNKKDNDSDSNPNSGNNNNNQNNNSGANSGNNNSSGSNNIPNPGSSNTTGYYNTRSTRSNNQSSSSASTGTVEGQGRSTYNPNRSYETHDAEFREVYQHPATTTHNSSSTSAGKSFIDNLMKSFNPGIESSNQLLLEDKH
jgi:uncharacterized protein YdiU (UPF0061 family)